MVLVPSPASWQNKLDGVNTIVGLKVLIDSEGVVPWVASFTDILSHSLCG